MIFSELFICPNQAFLPVVESGTMCQLHLCAALVQLLPARDAPWHNSNKKITGSEILGMAAQFSRSIFDFSEFDNSLAEWEKQIVQ